MPTKKTTKTVKFPAKKAIAQTRATAKKTVAKGKIAAKKTVARGKATATRAVAKGKAATQKAVVKGRSAVRTAARKIPTKRQATHTADGIVEHIKEGVQSGLDAVGRMVKKVTPNALLPKTKARRKT